MTKINLWECLTAAETNHRRDPEGARGPKVTTEDLTALGRAARLGGGQELSLEVTETGWLIKVFSCYEDGPSDADITIAIPKDGRTPIKVLKDQFGKIAHIHE